MPAPSRAPSRRWAAAGDRRAACLGQVQQSHVWDVLSGPWGAAIMQPCLMSSGRSAPTQQRKHGVAPCRRACRATGHLHSRESASGACCIRCSFGFLNLSSRQQSEVHPPARRSRTLPRSVRISALPRSGMEAPVGETCFGPQQSGMVKGAEVVSGTPLAQGGAVIN